MQYLSFSVWLISLSIMPSESTHYYCKWKKFILFHGWIVFLCSHTIFLKKTAFPLLLFPGFYVLVTLFSEIMQRIKKVQSVGASKNLQQLVQSFLNSWGKGSKKNGTLFPTSCSWLMVELGIGPNPFQISKKTGGPYWFNVNLCILLKGKIKIHLLIYSLHPCLICGCT